MKGDDDSIAALEGRNTRSIGSVPKNDTRRSA
jgi:hypothetical protein